MLWQEGSASHMAQAFQTMRIWDKSQKCCDGLVIMLVYLTLTWDRRDIVNATKIENDYPNT